MKVIKFIKDTFTTISITTIGVMWAVLYVGLAILGITTIIAITVWLSSLIGVSYWNMIFDITTLTGVGYLLLSD